MSHQRRSNSQMLRRFASAQVSTLSEYEIDVIVCTSSSAALDGDVWVMGGIDLSRYLDHPIVLWDHDMSQPIARATNLRVTAENIVARVTFPDEGISAKADEIRKLVKAGIITGVSAGIMPTKTEPLDPRNPRSGNRVVRSVLLEFSIVAVPADASAGVTARSNGGNAVSEKWKIGASRTLPIEDGDEAWDGPAAEASIFELAGGDDFDPVEARKGFLVYNADKADERGAYEFPIARAVDGKLVVPKSAIRAAASRLPDADLPDDIKKKAQGVIDDYKEEAGMTADANRAAPRRAAKRKVALVNQRGLVEVANLCWIFEELGWQVDVAKWESTIENDASKVPGMMAALLHDMGDVIMAMAAEEVAEALAGVDVEPEIDQDDLEPEERAHVMAGHTGAVRSFRLGLALAKQRAGKKLSAETVRCLRAVQEKTGEAIEMHRRAIATHKEALGTIDDLIDGTDAADDDDNADPENTEDSEAAERALRARAAQLRARSIERFA